MATQITFIPVDEIPQTHAGRKSQRTELLQSFLDMGIPTAQLDGLKTHSIGSYNKAAEAANLPVKLVGRSGLVYITRTDNSNEK